MESHGGMDFRDRKGDDGVKGGRVTGDDDLGESWRGMQGRGEKRRG
jgi:hypothetical protein